MKTRERNKSKKRTEIERFVWFIERIRTLVSFGWFSERSGEKIHARELSRNQSYTSLWRHTATRLANRTMPSPNWGSTAAKNKERRAKHFRYLLSFIYEENKFNSQSRWMNDSQGIFLLQLSAPFFSTRSLHRWRRKSLSFNKIINQQHCVSVYLSESLGIRCKTKFSKVFCLSLYMTKLNKIKLITINHARLFVLVYLPQAQSIPFVSVAICDVRYGGHETGRSLVYSTIPRLQWENWVSLFFLLLRHLVHLTR